MDFGDFEMLIKKFIQNLYVRIYVYVYIWRSGRNGFCREQEDI